MNINRVEQVEVSRSRGYNDCVTMMHKSFDKMLVHNCSMKTDKYRKISLSTINTLSNFASAIQTLSHYLI